MKKPQNGQITAKFATVNDVQSISDKDLQNEYLRRYFLISGSTISSSEQAALHLRPFFNDNPDREKFLCLFLSGTNKIIGEVECLFEGTLTTSAVYPREVIKRVLHHQAAALIISHQHPSGNTNPSSDDIALTQKIKLAVNTIDVQLHDHILIAGSEFVSFADRGLI